MCLLARLGAGLLANSGEARRILLRLLLDSSRNYIRVIILAYGPLLYGMLWFLGFNCFDGFGLAYMVFWLPLGLVLFYVRVLLLVLLA